MGPNLEGAKKSEDGEVVIEKDVENKVKRFAIELERKLIVQQDLEHGPRQQCITELGR